MGTGYLSSNNKIIGGQINCHSVENTLPEIIAHENVVTTNNAIRAWFTIGSFPWFF